MSDSSSQAGEIPLNYNEVLYWKIDQKIGRLVGLNLLAFPLTILFGAGFYLFVLVFGRPQEIHSQGSILVVTLLMISMLLFLLLHECVHGIGMRIYGARPKYGFLWKGLMFYATASGYAFRRNEYLVIALAPLISLSLLVCCGIWLLAGSQAVLLLAFCGMINGGGSIGDLWMSAIVLRYPAEAYVVDEQNGVRVFLPVK
jgi:hypothetical protein